MMVASRHCQCCQLSSSSGIGGTNGNDSAANECGSTRLQTPHKLTGRLKALQSSQSRASWRFLVLAVLCGALLLMWPLAASLVSCSATWQLAGVDMDATDRLACNSGSSSGGSGGARGRWGWRRVNRSWEEQETMNPNANHMVTVASLPLPLTETRTVREADLERSERAAASSNVEDGADGREVNGRPWQHQLGAMSIGDQQRPHLILITPTYARTFQAAYLTSLSHLLRLVPPPLTWIIVEDGRKTEATSEALRASADYCAPLPSSLSSHTADVDLKSTSDPAASHTQPCARLSYIHLATSEASDQRVFRGVDQRNHALQFIEEEGMKGIVFFMDDDNTYSLQLFDEIRAVRRIGVWPVAKLRHGKASREIPSFIVRPIAHLLPLKPIVSSAAQHSGNNGSTSQSYPALNDAASSSPSSPPHLVPRVVGWEYRGRRLSIHTRLPNKLKYMLDMAGFAVSTDLLQARSSAGQSVRFRKVRKGALESDFVSQLVASPSELEPLADMCRRVLVWHKHAEDSSRALYPEDWRLVTPALTRLEGRKADDSLDAPMRAQEGHEDVGGDNYDLEARIAAEADMSADERKEEPDLTRLIKQYQPDVGRS